KPVVATDNNKIRSIADAIVRVTDFFTFLNNQSSSPINCPTCTRNEPIDFQLYQYVITCDGIY
ncbi:hypothetical protein OFN60_32420, partial [Escherichia coli]|nr:hypothetical protein [Escherichia coli]